MNRPILSPSLPRSSVLRLVLLLRILALIAFAAESPFPEIHEVVANNRSGLLDEELDRPDWIELFNSGTEPIPLAGWSISDSLRDPRKWTFLSGSVPAKGYLLVFASGKNRQPETAPPLRPDAVPDLTLWLQAASINPAVSTVVRRAADGDFVRSWPDLSRTRRSTRQETQNLQPRFIATPSPRVRFDGANDLLRLDAIPASNSFTIFAIIRPTREHEIDPATLAGVGGTSGQRYLFGAAHGGDQGAGVGISAGTNGIAIYEHGSSHMPARASWSGPVDSPWTIVSVVYQDRRPLLSVQGVPGAVGDTSLRNPVTAPTEIGSGSYGAFAGDIAEVLVYQRALDPMERRSIETHLAQSYGISLRESFHTNFRIDADGERLLLTRPDGSISSTVDVPRSPPDVSWGRVHSDTAQFRFFESPTPNARNPDSGASAFLTAPTLSAQPGFHAVPFALEITPSDPGAEIRFTLDGSEPSAVSPLYSGTIIITNRASLPNRLSQIPTAPGWTAPSGRVFKGTVVRARAFRSDALSSPTATATYFVHPEGNARYSLPVVSLVTDQRHFFDPATGIYVPGNSPGGNYSQSGDAWERPVHVEMFETDGRRVIAQESGVRMHGNTSFGFPIKALRLHPLNQRGTGPFRHRIFPHLDADSFSRLLLRPSGHDHYLTMMRDGLMQNLVRETGLDLQEYRPAVLFLNGEYWGIHNLQEAFEKNYFQTHHPEVDPDAVDYLEGYAPAAFAYEGTADTYHNLVRYIEAHRTEDPDAFSWIRSQMDVPNFADYKIAEIFYYRWDIGNHRLWRPRTPDGRLRWILFDCDVGFGGFWSEPNPWSFNMLRAALEPTGTLHGHNNAQTIFLLTSLLRNPGFRDHFITRFADLMNTTLSSDRMLGFIDRMSAEIAPEMPEHLARWRAPSSASEWQRNVTALRTFARERPGHMRQHLRTQFRLGPDARLTVVAPESPSFGRVRLNTLDSLSFSTGNWSGTYFRGRPIELEVFPHPGFRFAGWRELPGLTENPVSLTLNGDLTLTPVFEPDRPPRIESVSTRGDGSILLSFRGSPATSYVLESSTNLVTWDTWGPFSTDTSGASGQTIPRSSAIRFFRARQRP